MAEVLFRTALDARGLSGASLSMGTLELQGERASKNAIEVMRARGVDLTRHRSQGLSAGILRAADRVFVMERQHIDALNRRAPGLGSKAELLGRFDGGPEEIDDPVNQDLETFEACAARIEACLSAVLAGSR